MQLYQTKKLLHCRRNHQQNEKATNGMGENICTPHIQPKVNIQNIRGTYKTQKTNNPV